MLEVILDTETTGLSVSDNHRIVEIGCIELKDQIATDNIFHEYINPKRAVSPEAFKVHGYSDEFLSDKKTFSEIAEKFINFVKDKKIIIHNASFDLSFLNNELKLSSLEKLDKTNVVDTLEIARQKYPGAQNSLDALCKRFNIDNSKREKHSALVDCELLKKVYINLVDQKEPKLNLTNSESFNETANNLLSIKKKELRKIIKPTPDELDSHKKYLKNSLQKNFYN
jgi:DNA polymerase III subunit epsilon